MLSQPGALAAQLLTVIREHSVQSIHRRAATPISRRWRAAALFWACWALALALNARGVRADPAQGNAPVSASFLLDPQMPYSVFLQSVHEGKVRSATLSGQNIRGQLQSGRLFETVAAEADQHLTAAELQRNKVRVTVRSVIGPAEICAVMLLTMAIAVAIATAFRFRRLPREPRHQPNTIVRLSGSPRGPRRGGRY